MGVIAEQPPPEMYQSGLEIECQCARCGSSVHTEHCLCDDGWLYEFGEEEYPQRCQECGGRGVFHQCLSSPEWCQANPLPGREGVERGLIEWFTVPTETHPDA